MINEEIKKDAESFRIPLIVIFILIIGLAIPKIIGSISLCVMECLSGCILLYGAIMMSYRLVILYVIFESLKLIQFLWVFGQIAQYYLATGYNPLFYQLLPSIFLWIIIATFVVDVFFVLYSHKAYLAFKYNTYY